MVKITRLPSGSYRTRVHIGGGKYKSITGKDKKDVQLQAAQLEAEVAMTAASPKAAMTLSEAVDGYISQKQNVLSSSTVRGYRAVQRNAVPELMQMQLREIDAEAVQRAVNSFAKEHSPKYTRNVYGLITATLAAFLPELRLNVTLPQKKKKEIEIPTEDEIHTLFEHVKGTNMELPVYLGACCGMRRSEVVALKWSDIDFECGTISINEALVYDEYGNIVSKAPKSDAGTRTIRMYPFVEDVLKNTPRDGKYVVPLTANYISERFSKILHNSGLRHYTFHALRHYLVSVMLSLNVPKNYIADYVGHENEHMIDEVYGHIMAKKKTSVEDVLQQYFSDFNAVSDTKSDTIL